MIEKGGDNQKKPNALTFREVLDSMFGFWWLLGISIGTPSLIAVLNATLVEYDPGIIIESILQGYNSLKQFLEIVLDPLIPLVMRISQYIPIFLPEPRGYWIDVFVIVNVWTAAFTREINAEKGKISAIFFFSLASLSVFIISVLSSSISIENGFLQELLIPVLPFTLLCYLALIIVLTIPTLVSIGGYLLTILALIWTPFGIAFVMLPGTFFTYHVSAIGAGGGILNLFIMTFVVARGAAVDAMRGRDLDSARLFLTVLGPFVGLAMLYLLDFIFDLAFHI